MSPVVYDSANYCVLVWSAVKGYLSMSSSAEGSGLRSSISLVSDTTISGGTGTSEDPYVVE